MRWNIRNIIVAFLGVYINVAVHAQNFTGTFVLQSPAGESRFELTQSGAKQLNGTLSAHNGNVYQVQAQIEEDEAEGYLTGAQSREYVDFYIEENILYVSIYPINPQTGHPVWEQGQDFEFVRAGAFSQSVAAPAEQMQPYSPQAGTDYSGNIPSESQPSTQSAPMPNAQPLAENAAMPLVAGQQYQAGMRVQSQSAGVSFVLPPEWLGGMPAGKPAIILGSHTKPGVGLVFLHGQYNAQQVMQGLNGPQDLGDGVILSPTGPARQEGNQTWYDYAGGGYIGHAVVVPGSHNNAAVFSFAGPKDQSQYYGQTLQAMAASTRFTAPQVSSELQQWRQMLGGMMLKRMSSYYSGSFDGSYVGGSSSETLHLCSDGSFAYFSSSQVAADGGGGASGYSGGSGGNTGKWDLQMMGNQVTLVLSFDNGEQSQHVITYDGEKTLLDGERVYRVRSDRCY